MDPSPNINSLLHDLGAFEHFDYSVRKLCMKQEMPTNGSSLLFHGHQMQSDPFENEVNYIKFLLFLRYSLYIYNFFIKKKIL